MISVYYNRIQGKVKGALYLNKLHSLFQLSAPVIQSIATKGAMYRSISLLATLRLRSE
jgi:hypothetical protein